MRNPTVSDFCKGKDDLRVILDSSKDWIGRVTSEPDVSKAQSIEFLLRRIEIELTNDNPDYN